MGWARTYRTPLWLTIVFLALLAVFAVTPDPNTDTSASEPTSEPTPGPRECVVCPIDQQCNPKSGQCMLVKHTPLPCVKTAKFDDKAGFCLPQGAPPAPVESEDPGRIPGPQFPGGIGGNPRQPNLPGFGD